MNVYRDIPFHIYVPSCRHNYYYDIVKCLPSFNVELFDGTNYQSCSKLMNDVIMKCPTEVVFVIHDKTRPTAEEVYQALDYVIEGHGMAWLWPFAFGAFKKDAIRQVGFYDERFADGHYEDCDLIRRFREQNVSLVMLHKAARVSVNTLWPSIKSEAFYKTKWDGPGEWTRIGPDEEAKYDLGPSTGSKFLPWSASLADAHPPATEDQSKTYRTMLGLE